MLKEVILLEEVYKLCCLHAYTTDSEEIMGLLLGLANEDKTRLFISSIVITPRKVKEDSRVEIDPAILLQGSEAAEKLKEETGKPIQCIGWYHSHPKITIPPSHVDLNTQLNFQKYMDKSFVGLIFGSYQTLHNHCVRTEAIAFQTEVLKDKQRKERIITMTVRPSLDYPVKCMVEHCLGQFTNLCKTLIEEEKREYDQAQSNLLPDQILGKIHNLAVHNKTLTKLMELYIDPIMASLVPHK